MFDWSLRHRFTGGIRPQRASILAELVPDRAGSGKSLQTQGWLGLGSGLGVCAGGGHFMQGLRNAAPSAWHAGGQCHDRHQPGPLPRRMERHLPKCRVLLVTGLWQVPFPAGPGSLPSGSAAHGAALAKVPCPFLSRDFGKSRSQPDPSDPGPCQMAAPHRSGTCQSAVSFLSRDFGKSRSLPDPSQTGPCHARSIRKHPAVGQDVGDFKLAFEVARALRAHRHGDAHRLLELVQHFDSWMAACDVKLQRRLEVG